MDMLCEFLCYEAVCCVGVCVYFLGVNLCGSVGFGWDPSLYCHFLIRVLCTQLQSNPMRMSTQSGSVIRQAPSDAQVSASIV